MPEPGVTQKHRLAFIHHHNARRAVRESPRQESTDTPPGRLPRLARLMALAIRFEHLLATGAVRDQTELAELGHVTRARVTQIMNMLHLAPDIQEEILHLPRVTEGKAPITERHVRPIIRLIAWDRQRTAWRRLHSAPSTAAH